MPNTMTAAALDPEPTPTVVVLGGGGAAPAPPAVAVAVEANSRRRVWEWEGHVSSAVAEVSADEAWALLSDFLEFHRWNPRVAACRLASGVPLAPGCVRYCQGTTTTDADDHQPPDWAHETLLEHDSERRFFRYEMNDNNMGFGLFFATFRVVPVPETVGCELRWEFECEPVCGTPRDALVKRLQAGIDGMAARVRDHVLAVRAGAGPGGGSDVAAAPAVVAAGGGELVVVKLDYSSIAAV